jgi:integrase
MAYQGNRPIAEHFAEFRATLSAKGGSAAHIEYTLGILNQFADFGQWISIRCITSESVERYLGQLQEANRSNRNRARYIQAAKQFARWLARTGRLSSNPLEMIGKPNPSKDRRHRRRMLLPAEWPWLKRASGPNAIVYELAIQTGLRSTELRSLKPSQVHAKSKPPYVLVSSDDTKDAMTARQYLTDRFAAELAIRKPHSRTVLFHLPTRYEMARMLRRDLAAARESWLASLSSDERDKATDTDFLSADNDAGEGFDFHALRHTCGAWLAIKNVHPKTIQTVMRHKSITLTMDTYGHLFPDAEPEAIAKLDDFLCQ